MSVVMLLIAGFFLGVSFAVLYGIIDGLFGEKAILAILVASVAAIVIVTAIEGIEGTAEGMAPPAYWAGFVVGTIVGMPVSDNVRRTVRSGGKPRVSAWLNRDRPPETMPDIDSLATLPDFPGRVYLFGIPMDRDISAEGFEEIAKVIREQFDESKVVILTNMGVEDDMAIESWESGEMAAETLRKTADHLEEEDG